MTVERFLEVFRRMGGDVYVSDRGDVVFDADPQLLAAVKWRTDSIRTRELVHVLRNELVLAGERVRARKIGDVAPEFHQAAVR